MAKIYDIKPLDIQKMISYIYLVSTAKEWNFMVNVEKAQFEKTRIIDLKTNESKIKVKSKTPKRVEP